MNALRIVMTVAFAAAAAVAQTPTRPTPERAMAVNVARVLNTAEVSYAHDAGRFGTYHDLRAVLAKWKAEGHKGSWAGALQALDLDSAEPLRGWELRVVVADDGKHYALSVRNNGYCDVNAFSDEKGVIYTGVALGCEKTLASR